MSPKVSCRASTNARATKFYPKVEGTLDYVQLNFCRPPAIWRRVGNFGRHSAECLPVVHHLDEQIRRHPGLLAAVVVRRHWLLLCTTQQLGEPEYVTSKERAYSTFCAKQRGFLDLPMKKCSTMEPSADVTSSTLKRSLSILKPAASSFACTMLDIGKQRQ